MSSVIRGCAEGIFDLELITLTLLSQMKYLSTLSQWMDGFLSEVVLFLFTLDTLTSHRLTVP